VVGEERRDEEKNVAANSARRDRGDGAKSNPVLEIRSCRHASYYRGAGCAGLIGVFFVCAISSAVLDQGSSREALPTVTPTSAIVQTETVTPRPTNTPKPTPTPLSTEDVHRLAADRLRVDIEEALGSSNRPGVERVNTVSVETGPNPQVYVEWAINDYLTEGLTKGGAQLELARILRTVGKSGIKYGSVRVQGTFSMRDPSGNVQEQVVVKAAYQRVTVQRVYDAIVENWDKVYDVADTVWVHPAFQK